MSNVQTLVPVMQVSESNLDAASKLFPNSTTVYIDGEYWVFIPYKQADELCNHLFLQLKPSATTSASPSNGRGIW